MFIICLYRSICLLSYFHRYTYIHTQVHILFAHLHLHIQLICECLTTDLKVMYLHVLLKIVWNFVLTLWHYLFLAHSGFWRLLVSISYDGSLPKITLSGGFKLASTLYIYYFSWYNCTWIIDLHTYTYTYTNIRTSKHFTTFSHLCACGWFWI